MNKEILIKIDFRDIRSVAVDWQKQINRVITEMKKLYQQHPKDRLAVSLKIEN